MAKSLYPLVPLIQPSNNRRDKCPGMRDSFEPSWYVIESPGKSRAEAVPEVHRSDCSPFVDCSFNGVSIDDFCKQEYPDGPWFDLERTGCGGWNC